MEYTKKSEKLKGQKLARSQKLSKSKKSKKKKKKINLILKKIIK